MLKMYTKPKMCTELALGPSIVKSVKSTKRLLSKESPSRTARIRALQQTESSAVSIRHVCGHQNEDHTFTWKCRSKL